MNKPKHNDEIWEQEKELTKELEQYTVNVPDFPMKKRWFTRISNWLLTPTVIPFEKMAWLTNTKIAAVWMPICLVICSFLSIVFLHL